MLYIYIYIRMLHARTRRSEIPLESLSECPLNISSKILWGSDNPFEHTTER